jgi:hypothetical protein
MAPGNALLNISDSADESSWGSSAADRYAALFAPLDHLLHAGGDERLALAGHTGLNIYGCKPAPRPEAISFSSSTASSISSRAYRRARDAQLRLVEQAAVSGFLESFESHSENMRGSVRRYLGLEGSEAEIVFSPSGSDAQLHALLLSGLSLGFPLTSIIAGSDQTGSGTAYTAGARHFGSRTARGKSVLKGSHISGSPEEIHTVEIPFADSDSTVRNGDEMDRLIFAAVSAEIGKGRKVLLQAMHASKLGWRAPSDECLAKIANTWPAAVQIVIDACQMRISPSRIADYLSRGCLILFTGSKFFSGPPFSGGLLVPKHLSKKFEQAAEIPRGLFDYADRTDLPRSWANLRRELALEPNFGQWLRWEAAMEEMRDYYALPIAYRKAVLAGLAEAVPKALRSSCRLEPLGSPPNGYSATERDEEFAAPTIFPFLMRDDKGLLDDKSVAEIYRALNRNITSEIAFGATPDEISLATQICHIGQPVKVMLPGGGVTAALRIAIGSRNLFEAWSPAGAGRAIKIILADVDTVIRKTDLILKNRNQAAAPVTRNMETSNGF